MPELPEVETVCRGLAMAVTGEQIVRLELRRKNLRLPFPVDMPARVKGREIVSVRRRAKYIIIDVSGGESLIAHLGMSGNMLVHAGLPELKKHDHCIFHLGSGKVVVFNDARRFGLMVVAKTKALSNHPLFAALGPEPLERSFTGAYLHAACQRSRIPVKTFIMQQQVVVGVGNIYASEALFKAKISPERPSNNITKKQADALVVAIKEVLRAAIKSGGSTLRDYVRSTGDSGYFQHQFKVYNRGGSDCFSCKNTVVRLVQAGRSSFYCPQCQR